MEQLLSLKENLQSSNVVILEVSFTPHLEMLVLPSAMIQDVSSFTIILKMKNCH